MIRGRHTANSHSAAYDSATGYAVAMTPLPWLNYHHLRYFHATVQEGTMGAAARKLGLAQPTLSGQIKLLEEALGEPLFERRGRGLELTETGHIVFDYAETMFGLGQELLSAVRGRTGLRGARLAVGVSDALPKLLVARLLAPVFPLSGGTRVDVRESDLPDLLGALAAHRLDLILTDSPLASGSGVRAYNHALGESGTTFFGTRTLVAGRAETFPQSLHALPFLLPAGGTALRRGLDEWLNRQGLHPHIVGEIGDSALIKALGRDGAGAFAAPTVVARQVTEQYHVVPFGQTDEVRERYWLINAERRVKHPGVGAVLSGGRGVFGSASSAASAAIWPPGLGPG